MPGPGTWPRPGGWETLLYNVHSNARSSVTERGFSFAFSWQRWLRERATLRYAYTCYFLLRKVIHTCHSLTRVLRILHCSPKLFKIINIWRFMDINSVLNCSHREQWRDMISEKLGGQSPVTRNPLHSGKYHLKLMNISTTSSCAPSCCQRRFGLSCSKGQLCYSSGVKISCSSCNRINYLHRAAPLI